jgi:hypothetical protein
MKKKIVNITFLAFFHLFLFVTPLTVKALHHDHGASSLPGIEIAKDICHICNFEFVTFKQPLEITVFSKPDVIDIDLPVIVEKVFIPFLTSVSLRAPPAQF